MSIADYVYHLYDSEFEAQFKLPPGLILSSLAANGETGAWAKLERGELTEKEFLPSFSDECSRQVILKCVAVSETD